MLYTKDAAFARVPVVIFSIKPSSLPYLSIMTSHTGTIEIRRSHSVALRIERIIVLLCLLASGISF